MKVKFLVIILLTFVFAATNAIAQKDNAEVDVTVFESVLETAKWANFKYMDQLAMAKSGDYKATVKLLEFSGTVDGRAALDHSVTLLELIVSGGDIIFADAVDKTKPKLRSVLLDRLQTAQGRTKKEELRKPLAEWAPMTWEVLNGKPFVPRADNAQGLFLLNTDPGNKPQSTGGDSEFTAPSTTKAAAKTPEKPKAKQ